MQPDELTASELAALRCLHDEYSRARERGEFAVSDALRSQLMEWGATGPDYTKWHPVFESTAYRAERLAVRNGG